MTPVLTLQALVHNLSSLGDRQALVAFHKEASETWTCAELLDICRRLASGIREAGMDEGEHVAIYSPNRVEWIIACLALLDIGTVPVPIDSQMAGDDLAHVLADSGVKWALTIRPLADRLDALGLRNSPRIILLDAGKDNPLSWKNFLREAKGTIPPPHPEAPAVLFYTSGVSGKPKGVLLSHRNLLSNFQALRSVNVYQTDERLLLPLPLHHVYPFMIGLVAPLAQGLTIVLPHSLTGPQMRRALQEGRTTAIVGVPRIYSALFDGIERKISQKGRVALRLFKGLLASSVTALRQFRLPLGRILFTPLRRQFAPCLRTLVYGGSPLAPELAWKLAGLGWQVAGGYGLTETSPILTLTIPGSLRLNTSGRPLPGVQIRIADLDPETGQGEIQAQGANVFAGYLHLPQKSEEAFTEDGWFRTGDLGYLDEDGELHIVGRASSRITLPGGEKIWPERIEEAMEGLASIRELAVLARDGRLVAVVVPAAASIQPRELGKITASIEADIEGALRPLPSYYRISEFVLDVDPLPRTRLGKIQRHKLLELFEAGKRRKGLGPVEARPIAIESMGPEDRQLLEDPIALRTWSWMAERFPSVRLTPDTNMSLELGLDSLEWMTLTLELHDQVSVDLSEEAVGRITTVRDLLREAIEAEQIAGAGEDPVILLKHPETLLDPKQQRWLAERTPLSRGFGSFLFALDRLLMRACFSLEVRGIDRLPPQGPCVLAPNHVSLLDAPAIMAALPSDRL
ncbi:AMP-binding protein, partial [Petrachloros mirabilis]